MVKNVLLEIESENFQEFSFEYKKEKWSIDIIYRDDVTEYWLQKWGYGFKNLIIGWGKDNKDYLFIDDILKNIVQDIELYKKDIEKIELYKKDIEKLERD